MKYLIGDCCETLKTLPEKSIHCCVTSPPYWGLRDYGVDGQLGLERTPEEYVGKLVEIFREVRRVLRDDGTLWLNLGDSYCTSSAGFKKQTGAAFKDRVVANTAICGECGPVDGLKSKDLVGTPWSVAFALRADGWYLRSDIIWNKPNPSPESVSDRPTRAHEYIFLLSKSARYYYDNDAIRVPYNPGSIGRYASRLDGTAPTSRQPGGDAARRKRESAIRTPNPLGRSKRTVWTVTTCPFSAAHFATFPPNLIIPCILAGCPEGGTVLDPFGGSGTTAAVALKYRRDAILCELNPEYEKLLAERIISI